MNKQVVVVLFGGRSSEHEISSVTAGGVLRAIDRERFEVIPVGITKTGVFVLEVDDPARYALNVNELPTIIDNGTRVLWPEGGGDRTLRVRRADGSVDILGDVDVVLPILHGLHGEDGTIQGFLDILELPYAGAGVLDSAICMDKHFMKIALEAADVAVSPGVTLTKQQWAADPEAQRARVDAHVTLPVFVKPARAGSSVGVSKVKAWDELEDALSIAFAEDSKVLIETGIVGREVEVAVLQGLPGEPDRASLPGEVVFTGREFYDFEGKYLGGDGVETQCPADLSAVQIAAVQAEALKAFAAVDGRGLARVDFFVTDTQVIVNELNTMPGFTPISMYPQCWEASGLSYTDLISHLIDNAVARA